MRTLHKGVIRNESILRSHVHTRVPDVTWNASRTLTWLNPVCDYVRPKFHLIDECWTAGDCAIDNSTTLAHADLATVSLTTRCHVRPFREGVKVSYVALQTTRLSLQGHSTHNSSQGTSSAGRPAANNATITCASAKMPSTPTSSKRTPNTSPSTGKPAAAGLSPSSR